MEASLYIHVPFCGNALRGASAKCDYCDFYSVPLAPRDERPGRFVETLLLEGERILRYYRPDSIPTLYIGGGTPSVLGAARIKRLLRGVLELTGRYAPSPGEITVEANPESAGEDFLAAAREGGASRLSLGVQSFYGPSRRAVRRIGADTDGAALGKRLELAAEYFPGAFSADLISGLPFQNEKILLDDIAALLEHRPAHVSFYALTVEPGTPLETSPAAASIPGQDEADRLWLAGRGALEKAGYGQYEVSSFCLPGRESRHNTRYWRMRNWLALGPAASGTIINDGQGTGMRYTVPPDIKAWLDAGGIFPEKPEGSETGTALVPESEKLDALTLMKESLLMGFRYIEGPDEALFRRRFGRGIAELIPRTLKTWRDRGLLSDAKTALTKEGLLFLNPFLIDAFGELDKNPAPLLSA